MAQTQESVQDELIRRHRLSAMAVGATLGFALALMAIGYLHKFPIIRSSYSVAQVLWVAIAMCGLGSIVLRRSRFFRDEDTGLGACFAFIRPAGGFGQNTTLLLALMVWPSSLMGFLRYQDGE